MHQLRHSAVYIDTARRLRLQPLLCVSKRRNRRGGRARRQTPDEKDAVREEEDTIVSPTGEGDTTPADAPLDHTALMSEARAFGGAMISQMSAYGDWSGVGHTHAFASGFIDAVEQVPSGMQTVNPWRCVSQEFSLTRSHGFSMAAALLDRAHCTYSIAAQMMVEVECARHRGVLDRCRMPDA
jgi:hypothetical protein